MIVDLTVNIFTGHFADALLQVLKNIFYSQKGIKKVFLISEVTKFACQEVKNERNNFKFIQIKSFFDKIPLYLNEYRHGVHKNKFRKLLFFIWIIGGFLALIHRTFKFTFILWKIQPDKCIFPTMAPYSTSDLPLLFCISFFAPSNTHYILNYHGMPDFIRTGSVRRIYNNTLIWLYKRLKNGKRITILSYGKEILRFFQALGFETKGVPCFEVERWEDYRRYPKVKAKESLLLPTDVPIFLFFGTLSGENKNLHNLIEVIDTLTFECILVIASEPVNPEYYEAILKKLNIVKNKNRFVCKFYRIPTEEMYLLFNATDYTIIPHRIAETGYNRYKHFSGVFWQSVAAGKPVIMTKFSDELAFIASCNRIGVVLRDDSYTGIKKGVEEVLSNSDKLFSISKIQDIYKDFLVDYGTIFL